MKECKVLQFNCTKSEVTTRFPEIGYVSEFPDIEKELSKYLNMGYKIVAMSTYSNSPIIILEREN